FDQGWMFFSAGAAPTCPEIDQYIFALVKTGQFYEVTSGVRLLEIGQYLPNHRTLIDFNALHDRFTGRRVLYGRSQHLKCILNEWKIQITRRFSTYLGVN